MPDDWDVEEVGQHEARGESTRHVRERECKDRDPHDGRLLREAQEATEKSVVCIKSGVLPTRDGLAVSDWTRTATLDEMRAHISLLISVGHSIVSSELPKVTEEV